MTMDICKSGSSSEEGQTKCVRWAPQHALHEIHDITHLDEMSIEEINDTWYQKHQYAAFKKECVFIWHLSINGEIKSKNNADEEWCERGLEHIIHDERRKSREWERKCAISSVLETQKVQRQQEMSDDDKSNDKNDSECLSPEYLAEMYKQASSLSHLEAHSRGLQDELAVVHSELSTQSLSSSSPSQSQQQKKKVNRSSCMSSSPLHVRKKMRLFDSSRIPLRSC